LFVSERRKENMSENIKKSIELLKEAREFAVGYIHID